ncbi:MAG: type I DNA topoisomerase [Parvibaculum sp.]|uniref:type I DNA topoisomerase n=1 Tax=Parvibaculum sp. TaxID=2024848 RepID=UPI0025F9C9FD|nr:type I DNA topoisomerase [Parvibaculum sp.]MCE9648748.1 type I DNA topoisomerase [Parvibaculum sp.]
MAASNIVIVESPAKAKTINKYLGDTYKVLASYGHVRDLVDKTGSVNPDQDFDMAWEVDPKAAKRISEIAAALKGAKKLILATDPDREGEAISWHLHELLNAKNGLKGVAVERVVFNAITKTAVLEAMANPRQIDGELVDAYLARRALDYLFGFSLSPVLWRKLPGARSAGRVQSVALRLVCEREIEIEAFKNQEYWTVDTQMKTPSGDSLTARLTKLNGDKLDKFSLPNEAAAAAARKSIESGKFSVASVESKPARRNPYPPFTTSTLQQEASRKLGFSASHTMRVAQRLYEGVDIGGETVGLITYMRTDGVDVAPEALTQTRKLIGSRFSQKHLPSAPRLYKSKTRNAQEAHEAIRPTDVERTPETLRNLEPDMARLYDLVWKRMVASQMEAAEFERTAIDIETPDGRTSLRANGSVLIFDGFLALYQEGRDDPADDEDGSRLPKVTKGDGMAVTEVKPEQHFTEPPPRFSEASLVKKLEELGIGRPSTYASILQVLRDRLYVRMDKSRFMPEDKGRLVTAFLTNFFQHYVEYDFTAGLEDKLDLVSDGKLKWKELLRSFWTDFSAAIKDIGEIRITQVLDTLNDVLGPHIFPPQPDGSDPRKCKMCENGTLGLRLGKFGAFIGCSNYKGEGDGKCSYTRPLAANGENAVEARTLGIDPETGLSVTLRAGRFGPYLQLGETSKEKDAEKPKRASIPKGVDRATLGLEQALKLLSLPRLVGIHPETGNPITANFGRFGPYIKHDNVYANVESEEDVFTIGLNHAVTVLADKKANPRRRFNEPKALKELGPHPATQAVVKIMSGKYGAYVTDGETNATLPKGADPATLTMDAAVELLRARAEMGGGKKKPKRKPAKAAAKPVKAEAKPAKAAAKPAKAELKPKDKPAPAAKKPPAKKKVLEET